MAGRRHQKEAMENVIRASKSGLKEPNRTNGYWLDGYALLVERSGILTDLEREFIKNGLIDELRVAKRPLEHWLVESANISSVLKQKIRERFVDWNFDHDKAYMVLILEPQNNEV